MTNTTGQPSTSIAVAPDPGAPDTAKIGERLKAVRRARRLTLEDVAEASDITKGFLSKIERGLASASVAALLRICAALDVPLATLFASDSAGEVVRRGHYPSIDFGGQDLSEYLLTPPAERRLQVSIRRSRPAVAVVTRVTRCPPRWSSCSSSTGYWNSGSPTGPSSSAPATPTPSIPVSRTRFARPILIGPPLCSGSSARA